MFWPRAGQVLVSSIINKSYCAQFEIIINHPYFIIGKTAVFAIPIIQKILTEKQTATEQVTRALVLAPTKELCNQLHRAFVALTVSCSRDVRCVDIASQV